MPARRMMFDKNSLVSVDYDNLILWYDAIESKGKDHFRDLSPCNNNGIITNPIWGKNYLDMQGDTSIVTTNNLFPSQTPCTVEIVDLNGVYYTNNDLAFLCELSENYGANNNTFCIYSNESVSKRFDFYSKFSNSGYYGGYSNQNIPARSFVGQFSFGQDIQQTMNSENVSWTRKFNGNSTGNMSTNFRLYIGSRAGVNFFSKMNLASFKIWNKILSEEERLQSYNQATKRYKLKP